MSSTAPFLVRRRPCLCRWVLACLLMSWSLAGAMPLIAPAMLVPLCGPESGLRWVDAGTGTAVEDGALDAHGLPDCALCLVPLIGAPPPAGRPLTAPSTAGLRAGVVSLVPPPGGPAAAAWARGPPVAHCHP